MSERIISLRGAIGIIGGRPFPLDADLTFDEVETHSRYELAQSASDTALTFNSITTASVVYIETDVAITYKLNGTSNTAVTINIGGRVIHMGCSVTSIHFSEGGTSAAVLKVLIAGT